MKYLLFALAALALGSLGAKPTDVPGVVVPCGTRADALVAAYVPQPGEHIFTAEWDARGGGTTWLVVPPGYAGRQSPDDQVTRHYSATVALPDDARPALLPVQVQVQANAGSCPSGQPLTVTNVVWRVGP
jgi:hypothetical protein